MTRKSLNIGLPWWLGSINWVIVALQRRGLAIGTIRLLSVPGRKSGQLRTTPVSPLTVDGKRYVLAGLEGADWVKNVQAAGWGILARGRKEERVALVELPVEQRGAVLRQFPHKVPHGVQFFKRLYDVSGDSEEFAALAPWCPVFEIRPLRESVGEHGLGNLSTSTSLGKEQTRGAEASARPSVVGSDLEPRDGTIVNVACRRSSATFVLATRPNSGC
jgi:deazaflavin-dependent oxidoreductase (nitroreductase family)